MTYCVNPGCQEPQNLETVTQCQSCGSFLLLDHRYRPVQRLGQSRSSRTFLAIDTIGLQQSCVIKQFSLQPFQLGQERQWTIEQLQTDAQRLKALTHHPHLPSLLGWFEQEGYFYWVWEWIEGSNLEQLLSSHAEVSEPGIWQILNQLLPAIQSIHEQALIHGDIKPENIIRQPDNRLVLVDITGLPIKSNISNTTINNIIIKQIIQNSSPEYAAPEQVIGRPVCSSDLYSLGITCIHLLTQLSPFVWWDDVNDRQNWQMYLTQPISDSLVQVLTQLTQHTVDQRFSSTTAAIEEVKRLTATPIAHPIYTATPLPPSTPPTFSLLSRHTGTINTVAIAPTAPLFASGSDDKTIRLWDWDSHRLIAVLTGHTGSIRSIAFSPAAPLLTSGSDDKTIRLWNWQTETEVAILRGHTASVRSIQFSADGTWLVSASWDKTIKFWHVATLALSQTLSEHTLQVNAVALSPYGSYLASASVDRTSRIWQLDGLESGMAPKLKAVLADHIQSVTAVAFSSGTTLLATGSDDNSVKIWDIATGELIRTLSGHSWSISAIAFCQDGKTLISSSWDQLIKLWQINTGEEIKRLIGHTDVIHSIALHQGWIISGGSDRVINGWRL